jgi:hypothetical protein
MSDTNYLEYGSHRDTFGPMAPDLQRVFRRAQQIAAESQQTLDTTHLLAAALEETSDAKRTALGTLLPDSVRSGWRDLAFNRIKATPRDTKAGIGPSPRLQLCLASARSEAGKHAIGELVLVSAIIENDNEAVGWLETVCALTGHSPTSMCGRIREGADEYLASSTKQEKIVEFMPAQLRADTQALLDHSQIEATKVDPQVMNVFANAHAMTLHSIAKETSARAAFDPRIPLVIGPKGSGQERIAQAIIGAPRAGLPFVWPFDDAYSINMAQLIAKPNARHMLEMALEIAGPRRVLTLIDAQVLDHDTGGQPQIQECLDLLKGELPTNVILVYRTDDSGKLPPHSRFIPETFRDFRISALDVSSTRNFVKEHFLKYWHLVERVTVAADAFEDLYPISDYIFENDIHFNLPYLPVVIGTNAAQTVKSGKSAILATLEEAQRRLREAQNASKANQVLENAFSSYFATLNRVLATLKEHAEPRTSQGLPLVTRELVTAELAASAVYIFQWPIIAASDALSPIIPAKYPLEGGRQAASGDR